MHSPGYNSKVHSLSLTKKEEIKLIYSFREEAGVKIQTQPLTGQLFTKLCFSKLKEGTVENLCEKCLCYISFPAGSLGWPYLHL